MTYQHIQGAVELQRRLMELPAKMEAKIMRAALRAGANVILQDVRARVPVKSGKLRSTLRVSTAVRRGVATAKVVAGNRKKGVFYAQMVERGTKAHKISARGKSLNIGGGKASFVKSVNHPGAKKTRFMAQAFTAKAPTAVQAVADHVRKNLAKLVK